MPEWTWHDKIAWFFGILLTGFLIWDVIVTRDTLKAIESQTTEVARAAKATEGAVVAAETARALAEDTARRELRAYICVDSSSIKTKAGEPLVKVCIKNCGQTPAYEVQGWIAVEIADYLPTPALGMPLNAGIQLCSSVVGPDGIIELEGRTKRELVEEDRLGWQQGTKTVFAYGNVLYKDAFNRDRYTTFRLITGHGEEPSIIRTDDGHRIYGLSADRQGNEAT